MLQIYEMCEERGSGDEVMLLLLRICRSKTRTKPPPLVYILTLTDYLGDYTEFQNNGSNVHERGSNVLSA